MLKAPELGTAVRVFVADASRMNCELMAAALRRSRYRLTMVGYATDSVGVRAGFGENEADVAVISAHLKDGVSAGFSSVREIRASSPRTGIIMLLDSIQGSMVVEAFRAGVKGILSREEPFEVLCKCIQAVSQGQVWANSKELHFVVNALARTSSVAKIDGQGSRVPSLLTKRETGVVRLVAEGLTNRDISQQLNLSEHTVRNYLFRIFNKVGISSRLELALYDINRRDNDQPHWTSGNVGPRGVEPPAQRRESN
jgi:two-component system nitrate/nitrite response regulator NarL